MRPLSRMSLAELRDIVNVEPSLWLRLRDAAFRCIDLRSPKRLGRRFRVADKPFGRVGREFELRGLVIPGARRAVRGVFEILAYVPHVDSAGELMAAWQPIGYLSTSGIVAYADRAHVLMMAPGSPAIKARQPLDAGHANLLWRCREQLRMSQQDFAWIMGASSRRVVLNWELLKSRIPFEVWLTLHKLMVEQNTTRSNPLAREIDAKILHPEDAQQYIAVTPNKRTITAPLAPEELARRMEAARQKQRAILDGTRSLSDDDNGDPLGEAHGNGVAT